MSLDGGMGLLAAVESSVRTRNLGQSIATNAGTLVTAASATAD
jgi:hypothetical protein